MAIGPVQLIVLGFRHPDFHGEVIAELERLRQTDTVRAVRPRRDRHAVGRGGGEPEQPRKVGGHQPELRKGDADVRNP
jgi:hypothetical protein